MESTTSTVTEIESGIALRELPNFIEAADGFSAVVESLQANKSATIDGAWKSSAVLTTAALARHVPKTMVIVLAHPGDVDAWDEDLLTLAGQRAVFFPSWDSWPPRNKFVDEVAGQRLRVLKRLDADEPPRLVLTTLQALLQPVPGREEVAKRRKRIKVGDRVDLDSLSSWLVQHGFVRRDAIEIPGEFSKRGGIFDVYSPDAEMPYRIEFFGDEVESIRQFSPDTQRSFGDTSAIDISAPISFSEDEQKTDSFPDKVGHFCDWIPTGSWVLLHEPADLHEQGKLFLERVAELKGLFNVQGTFQQLLQFPSIYLTGLPSESMETTCHLRIESVERFSGEVNRVRDELDGLSDSDQVVIACHNEGSKKRLGEVLADGQLAKTGRLHLAIGHVHAGFRLVEAGLAVIGDHELFHREDVSAGLPRRRLESRAIDTFLDLQEGDLVVHVSHGIARFRGMEMLEKNNQFEEHLILEFREGTRIYVPATKIELVQKYIGGSKTAPELSKIGGVSWQKKKDKVAEAVMDMASEMIELQAMREAQPGIVFPSDTEWQDEFEEAFPYQETPDQLTSLAEIKRDMQRSRPMDRLVCGDVGYGKTELAIRAAFKTVDNGKQVAILVPTTVLAEQHYRTFSKRMADYPFMVDVISRFRTGGQQRKIIDNLATGGVDIIIGTHRLLSKDVKFKDLGLVIIDEEQRFGVEHKEKLKLIRQTVDVLTLTATPIPRTLHLSLLGIRDISNLETPPRERLAVETRIVRWDEKLIRHAILREFNREGQVFFVHNRVHNIQEIASKIQEIVPEAKIVIGHGQMSADELEDSMVKFVNRQADILVATTIIESGLDIPNANTIFINQADNYGLADLHQLRGRVGRYKNRAYAYLLLDNQRKVTPIAGERLKAIEEFAELGAGFKIAMRDLEIRGAGNILGKQQSGHIAAVGYEMYCSLLENAVRQKKDMPLKTPLEVSVELPWTAFLPREYIPGQKAKIEVYRRMARLRKLEKLDDFRSELRDRFGKPPEPVEWLLRLTEIRLLAARWQIAEVHLEGAATEGDKDTFIAATDVVFQYRSARKIKKLAEQSRSRLRVVDAHSAYFRLKPGEKKPKALYKTLKNLLTP